MSEERKIVLNRIRTPDGTLLTSHNRHDYKTHLDKVSNEEYMVDGGTEYLRRNINTVPFEELSVYSDAPFEVLRCSILWGTRGKSGREEIKHIPICDLKTDHIEAILDTQIHISFWLRKIFEEELNHRINK